MTCVFTPKGHKGDPMSYNEFRQFLLENPKYWADVAQKYAPDVIKIHNLSEADIKQAAAQAAAAKPEVKPEEKPKPEGKKEEAPKEGNKPEGKQEQKQEKKSEGKPEGGKEGKLKTAAQKLADNLRRFAAALKETHAAQKEKAALMVAKALESRDIDVLLLSEKDFQDAAKSLHARNGTKYTPSADGWFFYKDGKILINKDISIPGMEDVVVYHEGTHPVINIIRNTNPELYKNLVSGLKDYRAKNPTKFLSVDQYTNQNRNPDLSDAENQARMDDEMIVETIAQIASGNIVIERMPLNLRQSIIDFVNTVLDALAITDLRLKDTSDEATFRRLATSVAMSLKEGRNINQVFKRELGFDATFDSYGKKDGSLAPNLTGVQARQAEKILNAKENLPKFETLNDVAKWLGDFSRKNRIVKKDLSEAGDKQIVNALVDHTKRELEEWEKIKEDYVGFYDEDIPETLNPELVAWAKKTHGRDLTNEEISLYHVVSSFASPSATPVFDSNIGLQIFDRYLRTGEISAYGGKQATVWTTNEKGKRYDTGAPRFDESGKPVMAQIARAYAVESLNKFKKIIDHFKGDIKKAVDWIESEHSYQELSDMMGTPIKGEKRLKAHENLSEKTGGFGVFAISGPKLGSYVLNRVGNYSTVTKDLWYARTMARLFGEPLIDKKGEVLTDPWANTAEGNRKRELADQAWEKVAKDLDTKPAVIQQRIWDLEKKIWLMLGAESSAAGKASEGLRRGIEVVSSQPQASYGQRTVRANAIANAATELANLLDETDSIGEAAIEFRASAEFEALTAMEAQELLDSFDSNTRQEIRSYLKDPIQYKRDIEDNEDAFYDELSVSQFNQMGRLITFDEFAAGSRQEYEAERAMEAKNIPIGGDIQQSKGSRVLNNTDIVSTKVNVAPLYSVKVNSIEQANSIIASDLYKKHKEEIQSLASAVGLKVDGMEDGIGGFAFDDGTEVKEATTVVGVTGNWDDIVKFAAVLGAITPEVQESTIAGQYVEEGAKNHKADEYSIQIDNTSAALIAAKEAGFGSSGFTLLDKEIKFFNVFKFPNKNIGEMIANFVSKYEENGGTVKGEARRAVESEYIDYDKRGAILAEIEKSSLLEGSNWAGVRDRISDAFERNKAFAKWKKINKSIPAVEYRRLRQEQIDAGERGEILSDQKLKRIKDLEELLVDPVARVFTNDEKKYLEAKAEIEAIANDIGKLVAGSFTSPFSIKRPSRGAIKVARWYSINPNLLGDGSRTNIIVNTDTDADFLFDEIKNRYSMEGDRVEYDMPTKLGYPKRLIEIRTSNGKIAEIQVMTQQGYLAKDGAKFFPEDVKNLAAKSLKEVRERLGWNIPDGVGHYFYEIERDTNVPFDLRQEAIRVSKDYYNAFLEPDSTLTDSQFRQDVSAFKAKVDAANKSKWDNTNKGEAPASLEEYLNEAQQPQASMGSRSSTGMQEAANTNQQVADLRKQEQAEYDAMPDPKNKAKREEIYDKYDKLISPLLAEQPQASMGRRDLPASVRDQIRDVIAKENVNTEKAVEKIRKILEAVPNLDKAAIDEMVQKYEERIGAKTETEYFFDYVKDLQALNKLNVPQARALLKQFRNFILSPADLDNALDFVDRLVKNKALLDKVNQAKESFRMLKAIAKNKKLSKADKLFLSNLATPKFYLSDEAELIKLREMALNFISSRLTNAEQKFTMAEIDAAYNEAAARRPAKERAKPTVKIRANSRPIVELAVSDALAQYSSQISAVNELSKMDLSVLTTETLYKILNALKVYDETGVLFDIGQITEMTRALNSGKTLKQTAIRATINKLAAGGISAKLQSVAAGANEIRRILVGGWDRNAARVTSDTQTMRDELNKKFADLKIGLPERFLLGAYGFFKEQSKGQTTSLKADVLASQMNYLRDRIKNAKQYSSSGSEMRMLEHYYNGATDALAKLGAIRDENGQWKAVEDFDIDSAVPKNVKEAWDYTQKLLQEKTQQYADALRLYHGRDFDLIQDYFPRSFYKVDVSSGDIAYGQGDQLPQMGSIDPVINKQSTDIADRNRGRTAMPWDGGFYILDGYETALNGLWDINATIHLSKDYAYTNALVNQGSILTDTKTNDAVKKYLISSVSGILRDPMLFPDTRAFFERFSDTAINTITSTVLNNFTQYVKQPLATFQGFVANKDASIKAINLMRQATGNPALADALNKFFNNTSAPYAEQLAYNELESKYYQGDIVSDKARGFLDKISPEWLVKANKFTQKQLLLTGYLAERGIGIDFIKEAAEGFNETALASAENFAESANSTANRHFLPMEIKDAKAYKKWLYFLSTYTFVATAQFWNNMGILTKPGYTATQKRMAGLQAIGFLGQQVIFQIATRGMRELLREMGQALGWLEEEDEDEEAKNREKYWYQILAGVGIDTVVGPYASIIGDSIKTLVNKTAEWAQDEMAETEEEAKERFNLLYAKQSELPGAYSILEPLWQSGQKAIKNGDEAEAWALGLQATALMLKLGDLYFVSKMKVRALESIFATADSDKLLRTMRVQDSGQYKNWVSEVRGAGVPDKFFSKLTYKVGDMGYYVDASDAKKFMSIYEKSVENYSKMIKQNAQANNFKISDNEIKSKAEKIAEKQAQMQVKKIGFKLPDNY